MTSHGIHIAVSWAGTLLALGGMALAAMLRQKRAAATLKRLAPRSETDT